MRLILAISFGVGMPMVVLTLLLGLPWWASLVVVASVATLLVWFTLVEMLFNL